MMLWTIGARWATKFSIPFKNRITSSWKPLAGIWGEVPLLSVSHQARGHSGIKSGDCRKGGTTKRKINIPDKKLRRWSGAGLFFFTK